MTKSDSHERAKLLAFGQGRPEIPADEPTTVVADERIPRVFVSIRDGYDVWRQLAPGETVGDENHGVYSAKMKQLIETGIVRPDPATQYADWPEGVTPLAAKPADVVDVHVDAKPTAKKAKKPAAPKKAKAAK